MINDIHEKNKKKKNSYIDYLNNKYNTKLINAINYIESTTKHQIKKVGDKYIIQNVLYTCEEIIDLHNKYKQKG